MFAWYKQSEVCYAYLSDVNSADGDHEAPDSQFRLSKWFTRGWTLQELLAPGYVDFFSKDWEWIGGKSNMGALLSDITRITDVWNYEAASVAQKMSWASARQTTRIEDRAYSLLGLFGVHMAPLYGEGENAFLRLQLEILSKIDDDSIFAWEGGHLYGTSGLLAPSPNYFYDSHVYIRIIVDGSRPHHSMTGKGVCVQFALMPSFKNDPAGVDGTNLLALLNCKYHDSKATTTNVPQVVMALHLYVSKVDTNWYRHSVLVPVSITEEIRRNIESETRKIIYVPQLSPSEERFSDGDIFVATKPLSDRGFEVTGKNTRNIPGSWYSPLFAQGSGFALDKFDENGSRAWITFKYQETWSQRFTLVLGVSSNRLWIDLIIPEATESIWEIMGSVDESNRFVIGRDRISRSFFHGSINAKLYNGTWPHGTLLKSVGVDFDPDGSLRWPVR
jgi:hypothetical protein